MFKFKITLAILFMSSIAFCQTHYIDGEDVTIFSNGDMKDNGVLYQMKKEGNNIPKPRTTNVSRKGKSAIVYSIDGSGGSGPQRSEHHIVHWKTPEKIKVGDVRYTGFSVYLPDEWTTPDSWFLFHQIQQVAVNRAQKGNFPFIGVYMHGNHPNITLRSGKNGNTQKNPAPKVVRHRLPEIKKNIWYDFVVGFKFSPFENDGWVYLWIKESNQNEWKRYGSENLKVGYTEPKAELLNNKVGLYRDTRRKATQIYFDEVRYARSFDDAKIPGTNDPDDPDDPNDPDDPDDCGGVVLECWTNISDKGWNEGCEVEITPSESVTFSPQPEDGIWSWTGPNGYTSNIRRITVSDFGTYKATRRPDGGSSCSLSKTFEVKNRTLSTPEQNDTFENIKIYPNPVRNKLNINLNLSEQKSISYEINNLLGQKVLEGEFKNDRNTITVKTLKPGIYIIKLKDTHSFKVKLSKFIVSQ